MTAALQIKTALTTFLCLWSAIKVQPPTSHIWLVGDSTMCDYESSRAPITGWGMPFANFFDQRMKVNNRAKGGRSTRTFLSEGRWKNVADSLHKGDYVLIQFGHNDEAKEERYKDRYTPVPDYKVNLIRFIRESRERQAVPILITPVSRLRFNADGQAQETHQEYTAAMYEVAKTEHVALVDLDRDSRNLYQHLGPKAAAMLFMQLEPGVNPIYPKGSKDNTHFNELGAREIAQLVLAEIRKQEIPLVDYIVKPKS